MAEVIIVSKEMLQSKSKIEPKKFPLTVFDCIMKRALYQRRILFYRTHDADLFKSRVNGLKQSLAETLVSFYPLAGRMRVGVEPDEPELVLDCSGDLGVSFAEAETDARLEDLGNFEPSDFCDKLCEMGSPSWPWSYEVPLLFVQITRFACGGMSIGFAFSHQACDGVSAWHFMNSWAEISRSGKLVLPPVITYEFKAKELTDEEFREIAGNLLGESDVKQHEQHVSQFNESSKAVLNWKLYKLAKDQIDKLKTLAANGTTVNFSSFEVICAYFWRKIVKARQLPANQKTFFMVLANCRGRFKSIPVGYFGNAIGSFFVSERAGKLIQKDLAHATNTLHKRIMDMGFLEVFPSFIAKAMKNPAYLDSLLKNGYSMVVSSPKHPIYECDFGFGKPVGVTFGTNDLHDGKLYLFPAAAGTGSVDVTVVLQPDALQRFVEDY